MYIKNFYIKMKEEVERMQLTVFDIFPGSKHTLYQRKWHKNWLTVLKFLVKLW